MGRSILDGYLVVEEGAKGSLRECRIVNSSTKDTPQSTPLREHIEPEARELALRSRNRVIILKVIAYIDGPSEPQVTTTEVK